MLEFLFLLPTFTSTIAFCFATKVSPCNLGRQLFYILYVSGFDVADISDEGPNDVEGLDASAAHVANLLSTEPTDST